MLLQGRSMMIRTSIRIATISLLAIAAPLAAQQPAPLKLDMSNGWAHEQSGLSFPASIASLPYLSATQFADGGWDLALQYGPADLSDAVSVYIYQAAVQDVGLLFSESRQSLENRRSAFGTVTTAVPAASFTPPGQNSASGLRVVYSADGAYKATGIAIAPLGRDWIVKFRVSSKTKSAAELDATLSSAIQAMGWLKEDGGHPEAAETKNCASSLPAFKKAQRVKNDGGNALLNAIFAGAAAGNGDDLGDEVVATKPTRYCRDQSTAFPMGIYRPDEAIDRYLISLGDSGRAVFVEPDMAGMLLGDEGKKGDTNYIVRMVVPGSVATYAAHDRMLSPDQAASLVESTAPASSVSRAKGDKTVNINSGALN
jgi:hypothetical protein